MWNGLSYCSNSAHLSILSSLVEDVDLQVMTFGDFGKDALKEFNVSPDGFIQNAIQLAYYK